jgi:ribonuclease BN (tRNA processing enzyme)
MASPRRWWSTALSTSSTAARGWGCSTAALGWGRAASSTASPRLRAIFQTHLHSDHTIDYPNIPIFGIFNGLPGVRARVEVYGPGDRGVLPPVFGNRPPPPVVAPERPTPGIQAMTELLYRASATDLNDRLRDTAAADPRALIQAYDIQLPAGAGDDPNARPDPPVAPWTVYEDERVRVSATLVQHAPVFPSFAFRFDTDDGAVVFSGDTGPTDNLVRLAEGADVLVHEAIDRA